MAEDPFESPKFLLRQTKEDVEIFQAASASLFSGNCYTNVVNVDPITGLKTYKVKFIRPIPDRMRSIASNAVNNIRHALDQALCCAVRNASGIDPGLIYFPVATNPNDLRGRLKTKSYDVVHHEIKAALEALKPYPTGSGYQGGDDLLAGFCNAVGPNKHQTTLRINGFIPRLKADSIVGHEIHSLGLPPRWDTRNNELIIGIARPQGYINYDIELTFQITFGDAGKLTNLPIDAVLLTLCDTTAHIISSLEEASNRAKAVPATPRT